MFLIERWAASNEASGSETIRRLVELGKSRTTAKLASKASNKTRAAELAAKVVRYDDRSFGAGGRARSPQTSPDQGTAPRVAQAVKSIDTAVPDGLGPVLARPAILGIIRAQRFDATVAGAALR
jgi:hypothetical protein